MSDKFGRNFCSSSFMLLKFRFVRVWHGLRSLRIEERGFKLMTKNNKRVLGSVLILSSLPASSAVYNFYFNNTEQGAGSTATPQLNVTSGAQNASGATSSPANQGAAAAVPTTVTDENGNPIANAGQSSTVAAPTADAASADTAAASTEEETEEEESELAPQNVTPPNNNLSNNFWSKAANKSASIIGTAGSELGKAFQTVFWSKKWNLRAVGIQGRQNYTSPSNNTGISHTAAMGGALTFYPLEYLGFTGTFAVPVDDGYWTERWQGELELVPLRLDLFGHEKVFDIALVAGVTNVAANISNDVSLYGGAKGTWNFGGGRWNVSAAFRGNRGFEYKELGMGFRF